MASKMIIGLLACLSFAGVGLYVAYDQSSNPVYDFASQTNSGEVHSCCKNKKKSCCEQKASQVAAPVTESEVINSSFAACLGSMSVSTKPVLEVQKTKFAYPALMGGIASVPVCHLCTKKGHCCSGD